MEFRLVYKGSLPSETSRPRSEDKRRIRSQLHPQLKELAASHPMLNYPGSAFCMCFPSQPRSEGPDGIISYWEYCANRYKVVSVGNHIHRFVPLITENNYNGCALDVLFLRRDTPGGLVKYGGDIDNRLKVLFDALRMPRETQEVEDIPQLADENPCFCLLSDDRYIDQISVTTDRLLSPMENGDAIHDVMLIIRVAASLFDRTHDMAPV